MKIIFLGTNGWFDTDTGNTLCAFIETKDRYIVLDAGNGIYKIAKLIKNKKKPIFLFISHYHLDHIVGLHILAKFNFLQGMEVYGPPGLKKMFDEVINWPYSIPLKRLKTKLRLHELSPRSRPPAGVKFLPLQHSVTCYGFRFSVEGKIISYTTDTGLCPNLEKLMKSADLAICESSFLPGMARNPWGHLRPEDAAGLAKKVGVQTLALVHFDAGLYHTIADREKAAVWARKIFKNTFAAGDELEIEG